ncbi:uncharacterized protein LOC135699203 [Ochlerotatus camptorhynchus]|uniref:uncharacterized protein LOC135699203 n=1 Tax=Ochlerotatus camptorhynchus TaxID=644619 RepID=UPI0031D1BC70
MALCKKNLQIYQVTLQFYDFFKKLIFELDVGYTRNWKPWQASIILATNSILRLQDLFLNEKGYSYLLTSRFTQDCVENLFSQIRIRQKKPTALQFKNLLKSVTISQFLSDVSGSSYGSDEREWLIDFPSHMRQLSQNKAKEKEKIVPLRNNLTTIGTQAALDRMNDAEKNVVFHIAGMIVHKVAKHGAVCQQCIEKCIATSSDCHYNKFTVSKDFTGQALVYVNNETFIFFLKLEIVFRNEINHCRNDQVFDTIEHQLLNIPAEHLILCHDLKRKLIRRFLHFRLKIHHPKKVHQNRLDSRSMAV